MSAIAIAWWRDFAGTRKAIATVVGSLLLGLFDDAGALQHVGVCASFTAEKRRNWPNFSTPYRENALAGSSMGSWAERRSRR